MSAEGFQCVLDDTEFDMLVLGTGLVESISTGALAKTGKKILVLDIDSTYASSMKTLNFKETYNFFTKEERNPETLPQALRKSPLFRSKLLHTEISNMERLKEILTSSLYKGFNIDFQPKFLLSNSLTVEFMRQADMDKYMDFRAVYEILHFDNGKSVFDTVPCSKGEIFAHSNLSLIEKRNLFRLLHSMIMLYIKQNNLKIDQNSISEFDKESAVEESIETAYNNFKDRICLAFLDELKSLKKTQDILLYTIAGFELDLRQIKEVSPLIEKKFSTKELVKRVYTFVKSMGVHSKLPYLYTNYGTGDIPQGFTRVGAVFGSIFIIHEGIEISRIELQSTEADKQIFKVFTPIAGAKEFLTFKELIVGNEYREGLLNVTNPKINLSLAKDMPAEDQFLFRGILVFEKPPQSSEGDFPKLYVIPPNNEVLKNSNPVHLIIVNNGSCSSPVGQIIVYAKMLLPADLSQGGFPEFQNEFIKQLKDFIIKSIKPTKKSAVEQLEEDENSSEQEPLEGLPFEYSCIAAFSFIQIKKPNVNNDIDNMYFVNDDDFSLFLDENFEEFRSFIPKFSEKLQNCGGIFFKNASNEQSEDDGIKEESEIEKIVSKFESLQLSQNGEKEKQTGALEQNEKEEEGQSAQAGVTENASAPFGSDHHEENNV